MLSATDAFGNALGSSIASANWGGNGQQTPVLGNAQVEAAAGSYWETHPMMYAANGVDDPSQPAGVFDMTGLRSIDIGVRDGVAFHQLVPIDSTGSGGGSDIHEFKAFMDQYRAQNPGASDDEVISQFDQTKYTNNENDRLLARYPAPMQGEGIAGRSLSEQIYDRQIAEGTYDPLRNIGNALNPWSGTTPNLWDALTYERPGAEQIRAQLMQSNPRVVAFDNMLASPFSSIGYLAARTGGVSNDNALKYGVGAGALIGAMVDVGGGVRAGAKSGLTIASNPANGNPAAIARGMGTLNSRQAAILDQLSAYGSQTITRKTFGQRDLAALTAATGDEFAMFSTGGRRLIYRGDATTVPITPEIAQDLAAQGWRWSSHVHPGYPRCQTTCRLTDLN